MPIAESADRRAQLTQFDLFRQRLQHRAMAGENLAVEKSDGAREVPSGNAILVVEDAAAQNVEQHVGVVMHRHGLLGAGLEAVAARHDAPQFVSAAFDRAGYRLAQARGLAQLVAQRHDLALAALQVGNDLPLGGAAGRQFQPAAEQVGTADAAPVQLRHERLPQAKRFELRGRQQHHGTFQPKRKHGGGLERFAGFRAVADSGIQGKNREPGLAVDFAPLVGIDEIAPGGLRHQRSAGRQDILQTVDHLDRAIAFAETGQPALAHEAVNLAGRPGTGERHPQVVVDLLETELVAEGILVQVTVHAIAPVEFGIERLPFLRTFGGIDAQQRLAARVRGAVVDLVDRHVGEQGVLGRNPAGGQPSGRRYEEPVVAVRDQADKKRRHPVDVANRIVALAGHVGEFTRGGAGALAG